MRFNFNKFSNREQILLFGLIILIFISALIFVISWLNTKNQSLEKENQNIVSRLNYIESIPSSISSNRNLYSDNISILVNSTSKEKNIQIDRTQPLNDNSMMVWVNEVNFIDLYNWMILMGEQGGEIEKMNVRKSKKDKVNAQISVLLKTN
jgi:type II secretory pathway component PulM